MRDGGLRSDGWLGRLLCQIGQHHRSRGHARRLPSGWVSRCRRCGIPLQRPPKGRWRPIPQDVEPIEHDIDLIDGVAPTDGASGAASPPNPAPAPTPGPDAPHRTD
jgi:hypothetical protein